MKQYNIRLNEKQLRFTLHALRLESEGDDEDDYQKCYEAILKQVRKQ